MNRVFANCEYDIGLDIGNCLQGVSHFHGWNKDSHIYLSLANCNARDSRTDRHITIYSESFSRL